jgi:salicylate hydroxylase
MQRDRIVVAGGGIGGLAAALVLANNGFAVTGLERAARFEEIGAGIQLGPNAFHALDRLKLGEAARSGAVFIDQLPLMDAMSGDEITNINVTGQFRERFGSPYAVVVQLQARELGKHVYHPAGMHALLRDRLMRYLSGERLSASLE